MLLPVLLTLGPALVSAVTLDCKHLRVDGQSFDLSELGGPHAVHQIESEPPSISNMTFTIDVCDTLKRTKGVPKEDECLSGTRVCGIEYDYNLADGSHGIKRVIPIAGEYTSSHGRPLDPSLTRLKNSAAHGDSEREGVRVELNGGKYPFDSSSGVQQKAIIEFVCDAERTGLEGAEDDEREKIGDEEVVERLRRRRESDGVGEDEGGKKNSTASLQFVSYKSEGEGEREMGVLRLNWRTKYACEGERDNPNPSKGKSKAGWGFFTWFLIVFFLAVASYLIFGSWLNYNRYGARGWDLLPHGDTIRDIPYTVQEWGRSAMGLIQGRGSSRGGYAAV